MKLFGFELKSAQFPPRFASNQQFSMASAVQQSASQQPQACHHDVLGIIYASDILIGDFNSPTYALDIKTRAKHQSLESIYVLIDYCLLL